MAPSHPHPSQPPAGSTMSLGDVYYILFRHKWKIVVIAVLGIIGYFVLPLVWKLPYESEAAILIRYVTDTKQPTAAAANGAQIQMPDSRGETIINTEMQILTSLDLAQEVATNFGPEKILAKIDGGKDPYKAALLVHSGLTAEVAPKSTVIRVSFKHKDIQIVQPILSMIIDSYINHHVQIHHTGGAFDDALTQETDQLRSRLALTEQELRRAKTNVGILSLEDTRKAYSEQIAKTRQAIFDTEAELAASQASAGEMAKMFSTAPVGATNQLAQTNQPVVPPELVTEYKRLCGLLEGLQKREQELLVQYTPENSLVKSVHQQMAENDKRKTKLETENPGLLSVRVTETKTGGDPELATRTAYNNELTHNAALQSKLKALNAQFERIRKDAAVLEEVDGSITELQRKKEMDERHYKYFADALEQARIDETFGASRAPNIGKVQNPSPPFVDGKKQQKVRLMVLAGSLAFAIGLAFAIELFLDPSLKRPADVEIKLGLPLFISIPMLGKNGKSVKLGGLSSPKLLPASASEDGPPSTVLRPPSSDDRPPPSADRSPFAVHCSPSSVLRPFSETLRDRLIAYFEMKNLTHKPKLVAVTSCGEGAGVSTVSAGLAAALSETGDGNVLLVDMNQQNGAAHEFFKGDLACNLDDALEMEKRDQAMVQDNLYVVKNDSPNSEKLPSVLPKRFRSLVPRLKASDYDYIIFDMPPVTEVSLTPRLSRFMDMVLVVAESEVTDRDVLKRATALLSHGQPNVGVVLNKRREYIPKRLQQEL